MNLKHRKLIFLVLIAILAGGSMAVYSQSDANFFVKTAGVVVFQQIATIYIFFSCFGMDLLRSRKPQDRPQELD